MPLFSYSAKNAHGEPVKGKVEAQSVSQAAAALRSRNLLVISVRPAGDESFRALKDIFFGIKVDDVVNLTRQLSTMVTAGLPLTQALSILEQQGKPTVTRLIGQVKTEIEGGSTFANALAKHPKVFSRVYIQLVRAGETGGVLDQVMLRLADNMEKDKEFRAKTKGALIYPVIVVIAMIVVALIMMIFVIPKLTQMYQDFGAELPLATRILIDISNLVSNFWWVLAILTVAGGFALASWKKTKTGQYAIDQFLMRIPIFGDMRQKIVITEFARTLSLLLGAGISLLQALDIVSEAISNVIYREALKDTAKQVEKGVSLAQAIGRYTMFPVLLSQMISVGEETGKLDEVLLKLSVYYQSETEHAVKNMTTAIEPMIMIVLGLGVGLMVIAIIMPIYNLTSQF